MKHKLKIQGLLVNVLMACFIAGIGASQGSPVISLIAAVALLTLAIAKPWLPMVGMFLFGTTAGFARDNSVTTCDISREIWEAHIKDNIFPDNSFIMSMTDSSQYVDYKTVHSPQANGEPTVTVGEIAGGADANTSVRTDTTNDWSIQPFYTNPWLVTNAQEVELSYSMMDSIMYNTENMLRKKTSEYGIVSIAPTGNATLPANQGGGTNNNILRSTGHVHNDVTQAISAPAYTSTTAAGNRLVFTLYDIAQAQLLFDSQDIPEEDRSMLMSSQARAQIISDMQATEYRGVLGDVFDLKTGKISNLMGFKIYSRSSVCTFNNAEVPVVNPFGSAAAATDNDAILFWQKAGVEWALGDIHVYYQGNAPQQYGDVISALVRFGCTKARTSELGVGAIVQSAAA